ncbi:MAG: hypothetical protein N4A33_08465 [Bacteriovoracaceae bacterium]|nr:hypothetical protein [Bacteriovoracaceae bacterium]
MKFYYALLVFFSSFTSARIVETKKPFDILLTGDAYYKLFHIDGDYYYTKKHQFFISPQGYVVDKLGYKLSPLIYVPLATSFIEVTKDAIVWAYLENGEKINLGGIDIYKKINGYYFNIKGILKDERVYQGKIRLKD